MALFFMLLPFLLVGLIIYWLVRRHKRYVALRKAGLSDAALGEAGFVTPLPVWATVKASYGIAWHFRREYLTIARYWLVVAGIATFFYYYLFWSAAQDGICEMAAGIKNPGMSAGYLLFAFFSGVLGIGLCASIAVAWHRLILRDERVTSSAPYLRVDAVVWSYFGWAAFLFLLEQLPTILNIGHSPADAKEAGAYFLRSIVMLSALIYLIRYCVRGTVLLPARALGNNDLTLRQTMQRTKGNFWALFFGHFCCLLPGIIMAPLPFMFSDARCTSAAANALLTMGSVLFYMIVVAPIYLSFLSLSYQFFFERQTNTTQ